MKKPTLGQQLNELRELHLDSVKQSTEEHGKIQQRVAALEVNQDVLLDKVVNLQVNAASEPVETPPAKSTGLVFLGVCTLVLLSFALGIAVTRTIYKTGHVSDYFSEKDVDAWVPNDTPPEIQGDTKGTMIGGNLEEDRIANTNTYPPSWMPSVPAGPVAIPKRHTISATFPKNCWIGIGPDDNASLSGVTMTPPLSTEIAEGEHTVIRSGCPGKIKYQVDGKDVKPVNRSKGPKSELVTLP
jgi:hypothetical protein